VSADLIVLGTCVDTTNVLPSYHAGKSDQNWKRYDGLPNEDHRANKRKYEHDAAGALRSLGSAECFDLLVGQGG